MLYTMNVVDKFIKANQRSPLHADRIKMYRIAVISFIKPKMPHV